ncbi:glycosyltransferase family 39 protein [Catenovulum sediminis]|uniref:glycosyltransferase family 39 protein n=1 Tax=Catenovulum sediminis TaxID=1740262 RepID=UPI001FE24420|nr:glycosyltransferase family 39 protein [Catenovulum sediminis]
MLTALNTLTNAFSKQFFSKSISQSQYWLYCLICMLVTLFVYREWVTISTPISLFYDEAYYLSWAQSFEWGYYSKPPVVAWLIALSTSLFGQAEWAVKLSAPVLYTATAYLLYCINSRWFSPRAGFWAACIFITMPLVSLNSLFVTTDAPQLFFWALASYFFIRANEKNHWVWWLLAGCAGGLGLLSKYTFILLPVAFLCFALVSKKGKRILRNTKFWCACLLAMLILLPNLYWNFQYDFISFQHTSEISKHGENSASFLRMLEFLGLQLIVFGPAFLIYLISKTKAHKRLPKLKQRDSVKLLWCLFWPTIVVISLQAFLARANMNWAASAYVAASLLAGFYISRQKKPSWLIAGLFCNFLLMLSFYHFNSFTKTIGVERTQHNDPFKRIVGWPEFVAQFQPYFNLYPDHKLASNSRKLLAYFGYYLQPNDFTGISMDGDLHIDHHYDLMYSMGESNESQFLFITDNWNEDKLKQYFHRVELVTQQSLPIYSSMQRQADLYKVAGFKGYLDEKTQ